MRNSSVLAAFVALLACGGPDHLRGTVVDGQGQPVARAAVAIERSIDCGPDFSFDEQPCLDYQAGTTQYDGTFDLTLKGSAHNDDVSSGMTLVVEAPLLQPDELQGPKLQLDYALSTDGGDLGPVALWEGRPASVSFDGAATFMFDETAAAHIAGDQHAVWDGPLGAGLPFDPRILEDARARTVQGVVALGPDAYSYKSGALFPLDLAGPGAPPSRGAPCIQPGLTAWYEAGHCPVTDGTLDVDDKPAYGQGYGARWFEIDLGRPRDISLVVVRSGYGPLQVEVSADESAWQPLGAPQAGDFAMPAAPPVRGRFVRVRSTDSSGMSYLTQLSVW